MAMLKFGNATVVTPVVDQGKWIDKKVPKGRIVVAKEVVGKYDPSQWLLTHATIVASVDVDFADPKDKKSNYLIKPEYSIFVNNNGDSWERNMLKACYRTFLGADNFCFPAGTRVLMSDGTYKAIDAIVEGDRVINRKGEIGKVTKIFKHQSSDLVEVRSRGMLSRGLFCTKEHPFWAYHARETCPKTGRPNLFDIDKNFCLLQDWRGFSVGVHKSKDDNFPRGVIPSWKDASKLNPDRDFLTHPVSSVEIPSEDINENRAELIGWFLAEGYYMQTNASSDEESGVAFALGNDETDVADRLAQLLTVEFGVHFRVDCKPRLIETESGSHVLCLSNKVAADFFKKWCGKYAWGKKLNEKAVWLPKKLQAIILDHCIRGDGCGTIDSRGYSLGMKSQALIQQLLWISWRLGVQPTYKEMGVISRYTDMEIVDGYQIFTDPITGKRSRPGYLLRYSTRDSKKLNSLWGTQDIRMASRQDKRITHIFEETDGTWMISKIDSVKSTDVLCDVYNIEVDNDNSYIVEGVIVHNCEHIQIPELSKGKVIDVVLREVPFTKDSDGNDLTTLYTDILIATNRKHIDLVEKVLSGEYSCLSMGCLIKYSICSQCGSIAEDESKACQHVRFYKNNYFYDKTGKKRIIAELCGRAEDPESCRFMDASWVRKPAFGGAVLRNILQPSENVAEKIQMAVSMPSFKKEKDMFLKAASQAADDLFREVMAQAPPPPPPPAGGPPTENVGFPSAPADTGKPLGIDAPGGAPPLGGPSPLGGGPPPIGGDLGLGAPGGAPPLGGGLPPLPGGMSGGMPGAPGAPVGAPPVEPSTDATISQIKNTIMKEVMNQIMTEIRQNIADKEILKRPVESEQAGNNSLVKQASQKGLIEASRKINDRLANGLIILSNIKDWRDFRKYGYNRKDVIGILHFIDKNLSSTPVQKDAVTALSKVKMAGEDLRGFFKEIIIETGRKPSKIEGQKLASWVKILRYFE